VVGVGDGPDEERIRALAGDRVSFAGRLVGEDLSRWYAAADAFVLGSRSDTWGIVLNEAAAAGLPLIASDAAGAGYDLIEEGVNGYRFPAGDVGALTGTLERVAADPAWRGRAGARSAERRKSLRAGAWGDAGATPGRETL